jgi:hypothetical protein
VGKQDRRHPKKEMEREIIGRGLKNTGLISLINNISRIIIRRKIYIQILLDL